MMKMPRESGASFVIVASQGLYVCQSLKVYPFFRVKQNLLWFNESVFTALERK